MGFRNGPPLILSNCKIGSNARTSHTLKKHLPSCFVLKTAYSSCRVYDVADAVDFVVLTRVQSDDSLLLLTQARSVVYPLLLLCVQSVVYPLWLLKLMQSIVGLLLLLTLMQSIVGLLLLLTLMQSFWPAVANIVIGNIGICDVETVGCRSRKMA